MKYILVVLFLSLTGCSFLRSHQEEVLDLAELAADNPELVCSQFKKDKDRQECLKAAELVRRVAEAAAEGAECPAPPTATSATQER